MAISDGGNFEITEVEDIIDPSYKVDDPVMSPKHYTSHPSAVECIEITRHFNFNRGNAIKYIWRAGQKGDSVEDLQKAIWYLQDEIMRLENWGQGK